MMRVVCDFAAMSVCELQKGYEPDEFSITGENGKVWGLRSSAVKLGGHLGHKVTVSGLIIHESKVGERIRSHPARRSPAICALRA